MQNTNSYSEHPINHPTTITHKWTPATTQSTLATTRNTVEIWLPSIKNFSDQLVVIHLKQLVD